VLIGRQGVYIHEWWWWPVTPGIAAASGLWLEWFLSMTQRFANRRVINTAAGLALGIFAIWTTQNTYSKLYPDNTVPFSTAELGDAIRTAAPKPDEVAVMALGGNTPQDYFYGDRPLRSVLSLEDFKIRLCDETVDLPFWFVQRWTGPASGIVFPLTYADEVPKLLDYLEENYTEVPLKPELASKFKVFRLHSVCPTHSQGESNFEWRSTAACSADGRCPASRSIAPTLNLDNSGARS